MSSFVIMCASVGYTAESIFGFGGSVITFLLLTQKLPAREVVTLLPVFALVGSLTVLLSDFRSIEWKKVSKVALLATPPLILGSLFMGKLPERALNLTILSLILLYGINLVLGKNPVIHPRLRYPLYALAGFILGATSLGIFFVPLAGPTFSNQRNYRASLALLWFITGICRIITYYGYGILTLSGITSALTASPFLLIGVLVGYYLHRLIPEDHFRRYIGGAIIFATTANILQLFS
ncbi:MAG: TSUP family transporter [Sphaerochaetaceae bacterium]